MLCFFYQMILTNWGRVTHICVSKLNIIGSDNGLSPGRRQAIIWTNAGILLIGPSGTNFSKISIKIHILSFKKMHLKMSSGKWQPFCLGLNVLSVLRPRQHSRHRYQLLDSPVSSWNSFHQKMSQFRHRSDGKLIKHEMNVNRASLTGGTIQFAVLWGFWGCGVTLCLQFSVPYQLDKSTLTIRWIYTSMSCIEYLYSLDNSLYKQVWMI